jgi:hypothetical protein
MEFIRGTYNWFAEAIPCLVWLFLCFGCGVGALMKLIELEDRLTRHGEKGMGNWFVIILMAIGVVGFFVLQVGFTIIGPFIEAHRWET